MTHNLYGIEIDERAGALAAFALTMKAREKHRRFFRNPVQPNICVMENIEFSDEELAQYISAVGKNLFTFNLGELLTQFAEAKHFGSLIRPVVTDVSHLSDTLREKNIGGQMFLYQTHQKVLKALGQAEILSSKYHVVVANPPYMGGRNLNDGLKNFAKDEYEDSKSDLFSMFIERNLELVLPPYGYVAMITMQSWMFLSSFENMREKFLVQDTILSMIHLGAHAFDTIGGEVVQTTAFVLEHIHYEKYYGAFLRLVDGSSEAEKQTIFNATRDTPYHSSAADFKKFPAHRLLIG